MNSVRTRKKRLSGAFSVGNFLLSFIVLSCCVPSATAQQTGGAGSTSPASGSTDGFGGVTTGDPSSFRAGDFTGNDVATEFVGGNDSTGFVGGGRQATGATQSNRQFRAIQNNTLPGGQGGNQQGTPRRVPVSLRIGFSFPRPQAADTIMAPGNLPRFTQFLAIRPELSGIQVNLDASGTATLTGFGSPGTSRLAQNLIRLQPGVRRIRNEVNVQQ